MGDKTGQVPDDDGTRDQRPPDEKNKPCAEEKDGNGVTVSKFDLDETDDEIKREQWSSPIEFILSCIGFAVGLGNVWRFPYLCYKNGGGAFLIPYFIFLVGGGIPVFFLEVSLGQFMSQGGLGAWNICPVFQGIGVACIVIVFLMNCYYIIILAWDIFYLVESFTSVLPWSHCNNTWNTDRCSVSFNKNVNVGVTHCSNVTGTLFGTNASLVNDLTVNCTNTTNITTVDPVVEFWERRILQISGGVDEVGTIVWQLALSLLVIWIIVYFCIWKGVKWTGKVVYFTATFPYLVITALLIRGVTLPGAEKGIEFYLKPKFHLLASYEVWIDAGTQVFFSYAIALGAMIALGSYNKFHNNHYKDVIIISLANSGTSLYAGFAIFSVLGFMAYEQGVDITEVAESGPGLAFIAYPKAVTQMPIAPLWAILFFLMIIFLGLDSQFVGVEAFVTSILDLFPRLLRKGYNREIFIAIYCFVSFCVGLLMVTNGGMYVFQLFDYYSASGIALLWVCFCECAAIGWIYGASRFYKDIELMLGFKILPWFWVCWIVITPLITMGMLIFFFATFKPLTYNKTYEYPPYAQGLGMCMAFASMICIPLTALYRIARARGTLAERWRTVTTPVFSESTQKHVRNAGDSWSTISHSFMSSRDTVFTLQSRSYDLQKV